MKHAETTVRIAAPARLHLGFLDPSASLGRRFGSIGLGISGLDTVVTASPSARLEVRGSCAVKVRSCAERVIEHFALPKPVTLSIDDVPPRHAGLGSGTQLALAVGTAVLAAFGRCAPPADLAALLGRGRRSGIGVNLFELGGLVVDGGHGPGTAVPPVTSRLAFPEDWHAVLVLDAAGEGLSGPAERNAFRALAPMPRTIAAHLCHVTLMGVLPAVAERDFETFCRHLADIQARVGDYFASAQAGRFSSPLVCAALEVAQRELGLGGVGQSSWGPTGFAFAPDAQRAAAACRALERRFSGADGLSFRVCAPCNHGASLDVAAARDRPLDAERRVGARS